MSQRIEALQHAGGNTPRIISMLRYSPYIHLAAFGLYGLFTAVLFRHIFRCEAAIDHESMWTWHAFLFLVFMLPGSVQLSTLLLPMRLDALETLPDKREFDNIFICLVTRGTNVETVKRGARSMRGLLNVDQRIRFTILTDARAATEFQHSGMEVMAVPSDFMPPKARYKARALEYFRLQKGFTHRDWVLHLDEETMIDEHCLQTCILFIKRAIEHDYGQGSFLYTSKDYWKRPLLTYADLGRARDDFGRFQFAHNILHFPLNGVHGSFLLVCGSVENCVGWDTDSIVEDFWFSLEAWRQGFSGGFIPSFAREQSCTSVGDFLRQRRRWACGIYALSSGFTPQALCAKAVTWLSANLDSLLMLCLFLYPAKIRLPVWMYAYLCVYCGAQQASLAISLITQDIDTNQTSWSTTMRVMLLPIYSVFTVALHHLAMLYSVIFPANDFDVVEKL